MLFNSQDTLVMGSDSRTKNATADARADSILIFHTDPGKHLISMLSIPRDLNVPIPGHGVNKINAAFAYGGPPLLIKTINRLTGLKINHVVLVDFSGFKDLINTVGGVTVDNPYKVISSQPFDGVMWHSRRGTSTWTAGARWRTRASATPPTRATPTSRAPSGSSGSCRRWATR